VLHLPKKRPWILIVILYVTITSVWITYFIIAHKSHEKHMTPDEAEQYIKDHPIHVNYENPTPKNNP